MSTTTLLIKNGQIINRGAIIHGDIYVKNDIIEQIAPNIDKEADTVIDAEGKWVMPGIIDDQVHFREPGLTYKCGVKVFMGSSTGNMLVDNEDVLTNIFSKVDMLIATHCEDEATIRANMAAFKEKYGENLDATHHPLIRNTEGCLISSTLASDLAKKYNTRLHILHISTADEIALFTNEIPLEKKRITSEACVHHMYFTADDYPRLGNRIKCNPAIKAPHNREAIRAAVLDGTIDIIATDHAPHTKEEKSKPYTEAPAGLPLIQHSLNIMLDLYRDGIWISQ